MGGGSGKVTDVSAVLNPESNIAISGMWIKQIANINNIVVDFTRNVDTPAGALFKLGTFTDACRYMRRIFNPFAEYS